MKNKRLVNKALKDIYKLDVKLKRKEKRITKILEELLALQDSIVVDKDFVDDLNKLLAVKKKAVSKKTKTKKPTYFASTNFIIDLSQAFLIFAVFILLLISFFLVGMPKNNKVFNLSYYNKKSTPSSFYINRSNQSFGFLDLNFDVDTWESEAGLSDGNLTEPNDVVSDMYPSYRYVYNYEGENFDTFNDMEFVYKKAPVVSESRSLSSVDFNRVINVDIARLLHSKLYNINLKEDRDFGYIMNLNFDESSFSFYKNWSKWPNISDVCPDYNEECLKDNSLSSSDILSDSQVIDLADDFIKKYKLDLKWYGEPLVVNKWDNFDDDFYVPEFSLVVYPLLLDDQFVYDNAGDIVGLNVEIDLREKRVASVYNGVLGGFERSKYRIENDTNKIIDFVNNINKDIEDDNLETRELGLGSPELRMARFWSYNQPEMLTEELYVPVYAFPIKDDSDSLYLNDKYLLVPAISDFFISNSMNFDNLDILPYLEDDMDNLE